MRRAYTLQELLAVVAILAAAALVALPLVRFSERDALATARDEEMAALRRAFALLDADLPLTPAVLGECGRYGLWPLFGAEHPDGGEDLPIYSRTTGSGWRGPYAEREGLRRIDPGSVGQEAGLVEVPAAIDPYGNHYRVLVPLAPESPGHLALVSTGPDGLLQTTRVPVGGAIVAGGDDRAVPLLPLSP